MNPFPDDDLRLSSCCAFSGGYCEWCSIIPEGQQHCEQCDKVLPIEKFKNKTCKTCISCFSSKYCYGCEFTIMTDKFSKYQLSRKYPLCKKCDKKL